MSFFIQRMGQEEGPYTLQDLRSMVSSGQVTSTTMIKEDAGSWFPATEVPGLFSSKDWLTVLLLSFFLGGLGVDRFYLGQTGLGVAKLLTAGGCGVWAVIDLILIALNRVPDSEGLPLRK